MKKFFIVLVLCVVFVFVNIMVEVCINGFVFIVGGKVFDDDVMFYGYDDDILFKNESMFVL